ncbi:MAG TPA: 30S ribosomal protein S16 [Spirochaetota bacterium]|nr:30S ribosomal protein S16 [Spirochaetota bacterium]HOA07109.1 30S ribosomal protein S16 [Spirochaetota bacterium]HOF34048.1 30S ribosomal protein S16 [Spirochaetota bacterium]HOH37560.1 30S ribosomal protein S16 [Spirochaetota bacterium]HOR44864.1 30S ribosomal protein S16 [Spirochaetota bacterium]
MVKIRLQRAGAKKRPYYKIVAIDERTRRDGSILESLGFYNPVAKDNQVGLEDDKVKAWLAKGAQPSATVKGILKRKGLV